MSRSGLALVIGVAALAGPADAQGFNPFGDMHTTRAYQDNLRNRRPSAPQFGFAAGPRTTLPGGSRLAGPFGAEPGPALLEGGPRPGVAPMPPATVAFRGPFSPGQVVIDTSGRQLFLVQAGGTALRYPISVGREGFTWTGTEKISRIADWPDWHPPLEMRERDPRLPEKMTGGINNPLGVKALYLGKSLYRIHGTNDARTIGLAASSGCFRMLNGHVVDLANRVGVGTTVTVLSRLPAGVTRTASEGDIIPLPRPRRAG